MPGLYAHYRFGKSVLPLLSPDQQRTARRFRQLFDMGLHGPDVFYYADPLGLRSNGKLGKKFHSQTGQLFFEHVLRSVKLKPSEGAMAYLYGLLAHYALDAMTQPFITKNTTKDLTDLQIMAEFDRYLLVLDGKTPAHLYDGSRHIQLTAGECQTVAALYPGVSAAMVEACVKNMARCTHSLVMPKGKARDLKTIMLHLSARETAHRMISTHPNRACAPLDPSLLRLYELAQKRYCVLVEQMHAHLRNNSPLGADFSSVFE